MEMTFGQRIQKYINHKGLSVRAFEIKSSLKNGAIYRVIKNGTSLNGDSIASIGKEWTDLNLNWLMVGAGDMLLESSMVQEPDSVYGTDPKIATEVKWCKEALERADAQIALQKEMIDTLKQIIERQRRTAREKGIDL